MCAFSDNSSGAVDAGSHIPVLLNETRELLTARSGGKFAGCDFWRGGHSRRFLSADSDIVVVAIDCDPSAIERARVVSEEFEGRFHFYSMNFSSWILWKTTGLMVSSLILAFLHFNWIRLSAVFPFALMRRLICG